MHDEVKPMNGLSRANKSKMIAVGSIQAKVEIY